MPSPPHAGYRRFHGWNILGLCTLCQFVSMGFTLYLIGVYIEPLAEAFSASQGQIGSASAIFAVFGAALGPFLGHWSDKGRTRAIMIGGAICMALGVVLLSRATSLSHGILLVIFLLAPGSAMLGSIPTTVMVVQWFKKRRGMAIGITAAGISMGGFVMPPVAAWLINALDWRGSLLVMGGLMALILLPAILKIAVAHPSEIGQYADGGSEPPEEEIKSVSERTLAVVALLRMRDFWVISLSVGVLSFFGILIITYLTPYARETGMTLQTGALMVSLYSISGIAGKFCLGWICDYFPPRRMLSATLALAALGWIPILLVDNTLAFMTTATVVGFAMGGLIPVWSSLVALNFGPQNFGRVRGIMSLALITATVIPGPLGGYLHDTTGTHATAFTTLWWILPIGVLISLFISRPQVAEPSESA